MWRSLRMRLVASYLLLSIVLLGVTGLVFSAALAEYALREQSRQIPARREQAIAYMSQVTGQPSDVLLGLQRLFPDFEVAMSVGVQVFRMEVAAPPPPLIDGQPMPIFMLLRARMQAPSFTLGYAPEGRMVAEYRFMQRSTWPIVLRTFSSSVALILGVGVGVAALLGWWLSRWLSRPISSLAEATAAVAGGDFDQVVPRTGIGELDRLVTQFNRMSQQLQESFRSLAHERDAARRFAGDAAHELKTPITALRAYHEIAESRPDRREQMLAATSRQIQRLERIVGGLIRMASITEGVPLRLTPADLRELVQTAKPGLRAEVENAGHVLVTDVANVQAIVEPDLLLMALTNLVENACKFTPAEGRIVLRVAAAPGEALVSISDTGVGIPAEEIPHIFERFHRAIDTQSIPGSGLGLALVKEAIGLMGGSVSVESEVGRGSRFTIHLPLYNP